MDDFRHLIGKRRWQQVFISPSRWVLEMLNYVSFPATAEENIVPVVSKSPLQWVLEHHKWSCEFARTLGAARRWQICQPWPYPRKVLPPLAANSFACHIIHTCGNLPQATVAFLIGMDTQAWEAQKFRAAVAESGMHLGPAGLISACQFWTNQEWSPKAGILGPVYQSHQENKLRAVWGWEGCVSVCWAAITKH